MIQQNHGKCGICGDSYSDPEPRAHEAGGDYARGIVVKRYSPGQVLCRVIVLLTLTMNITFLKIPSDIIPIHNVVVLKVF